MRLLDADIGRAKALIIDGNPTSRSVMAAQLRELGVPNVRQMSKVQDARLVLEESPHDIVLCEMNFEGAPMSGQDLLEELRREQLLPYSTVFMLVTGHATYAQVVEAAEATVDGYLVKPYSAAVLAERLSEIRRRKRSLKPIYDAIQSGDLVRAAALAEVRYQSREAYWSFAAQVAAELWLRADQPRRALEIYSAVAADKGQGWAKAGVARVKLASGELAAARRQLDALVAEFPGFADAHDLLGRVLVEQGEFVPALEAFRTASNLTTGCLLRMQHRGTLAFYLGHKDEAVQQLERTVGLGRKSKLFDALCLALLALLRFDQGDGRGLAITMEQMSSMLAEFPQSRRLARMRRLMEGLLAVRSRRPDEALAIARELCAEVMEPAFDLEAAALAISLWARLPVGEVPLKEFDALLRTAGRRFSVSKACTEVLVGSAGPLAGAVETLRHCHADITHIAEEALKQSLAGHAAHAVDMLLQQGERTRNAKLIDMATVVARRHADKVPDLEAVEQRARRLQEDYCAPLTHLAGVRRTARMPGGLVLRT